MITSSIRGLLFFLLLGCGLAAAQGPRVIVTISPYASLVEELLGGEGEVAVLLPPGASPHTYEPTPRQAVALGDADIVVMNGGVDEWLHGLLRAAGADAVVVEALAAAEELLSQPEAGGSGGEADDDAGGEEGHGHGEYNPHLWLDPLLLIPVVEETARALAQVDPADAEAYLARAETLALDLRALDAELRELLAPVRGAPFVPFHDAWPYFAARYDLDLIVELEPFPGREPSPAYLAQALSLIRESGAPAIFSEVGLPTRPAEVLAHEAGVSVHLLDPLGTPGQRYRDLLLHNAGIILAALRMPAR